MGIRLPVFLSLAVLWYSSGTAEVLYEVISPNPQGYGDFGCSVSSVGDVNRDGYDDVLIGARHEEREGSPNYAGTAYVVSGATGACLHALVSPHEEFYGRFGCSVSGTGDMDHDGVRDVVIGANGESVGLASAGRAYVFSGATGGLLSEFVSGNPQPGGRFGTSVSFAGDVNGDGYDDVVVGAPYEYPWDLTDAGRVYLFNGSTGNLLYELVSPNAETYGRFGYSVSCAGDINDDGYDDVAVGASAEDPGASPSGAGRVYVFNGANSTLLRTLHSPNEVEGGMFGRSIARGGDLNSDGFVDLIVGASHEGPSSAPNCGRAYLFSGATGNLLHTLASPNQAVDGWFGRSVACAGDVDGDGCADVIIGAIGEAQGSSPEHAGRAYVFSVASGKLYGMLASPNECYYGYFGGAVSGAGDVNGDGYGDVLVGAPQEGTELVDAGGAYLFSWLHLSGDSVGGSVVLAWSTWMPADAYWVYGAANVPWFAPDLSPPTYVNRVAIIPGEATNWSTSTGVGDPGANWTYMIVAIADPAQELARSNRAGEIDFQGDLP